METNIKLQTLIIAVILVGLLCLMSLLWSCRAALIPSAIGDSAVSDASGVTVYTQSGSYPSDTKEIDLYIYNHTGGEIAFGIDWELEVKQGDSWYMIPFKDGVEWIELAQTVADSETGKITVDLSKLDYSLATGKYRVIKNINGSYYTAEFTVDDNATEDGEVTFQ